MFGFFKSKQDKEIDKMTKTLMDKQEPLYYAGNVVEDIATNIVNRYKLTASTIIGISYPGLLTADIENSGYVVVAISKDEFITVNYQENDNNTAVMFGANPSKLLNELQKDLQKLSQNDDKEELIYRDYPFINIVGAVTGLGYEVGIMHKEGNTIYLPFNYKDKKITIVYSDEVSIRLEDSNTQIDKYGLLEAINKLDKSDASSLRLSFKNMGETMNAIKNMNLELASDGSMMCIIVNDNVYGIYVKDDKYIEITDFSDRPEKIDLQALRAETKIREEEANKKMEELKKKTAEANKKMADMKEKFGW